MVSGNFSISSFSYRHNDNSTLRGNEYGQMFVDVRNLQKKLHGDIQYANKVEVNAIDNMLLRNGRHKPLWVIVDKDSNNMDDGLFRLSTYGYLKSLPTWSAASGQHYNCVITVEQAI